MESLTYVSPSIILPPTTTTTIPVSTSRSLLVRPRPHRSSSFCGLSSSGRGISISKRRHLISCKSTGRGGSDKVDDDEDGSDELERALHLDGTIPGTSDEFVRQVSSRAYEMRRKLEQTFDSTSYDVLESNPWRGDSKPVYVLTHRENQICTMKTRTNHSEVEKELGLLFSRKKQSRPESKFDMLVEDIRDGVLVFEDMNEAVRYCDLLQGGGKGCEGVAEIDASSVFDLCRKTRSLAVLFRRGRTPPTPQTLERNLGSRKRSLEDLRDSK